MRLVCRGFNEPVYDKDETYASTPGITSLKLVLNHALNKGHKVYVGDISTAFLHADVKGTVYVRPPPDYVPKKNVKAGDEVLWKLKKAMYGLKSAPKSWQTHFVSVLIDLGFQQMKSLHVRQAGWRHLHHCAG